MSSLSVVHVTQLRTKYWKLFKLTSMPSFVKCSCKRFLVVQWLSLTNLTIFQTIRLGILRGQPDLGKFAVELKCLFYFIYYLLNRRLWCIQLFIYISIAYSSFIPANNSTFYIWRESFTFCHDVGLRTDQPNQFLPKMNLIDYYRMCCSFKNSLEHFRKCQKENWIIE